MLALADRDGVVYGSIPGLADSAHITLEECESALQKFQEPDKYSSTKDYDGRRIEVVVGGWRLLNYFKYRELQSLEDVREKARIRVQNHRARKKHLENHVTLHEMNVTPGNTSNDIASASASASAEVLKSNTKSKAKEGASRFAPPTLQEVSSYIQQHKSPVNPEAFVDFYESKGWKIGNSPMKDWRAAVRTWERRDFSQPTATLGGGDPKCEHCHGSGQVPSKIQPGRFRGCECVCVK